MTQIITFTEDELVQMLEGGEVMMEEDCLKVVDNNQGIQLRNTKHTTIFKKETKDDTFTS